MTIQPTYATRSSRVVRQSELSRYKASQTYRNAQRRESRRLLRMVGLIWLAGAALILAIVIVGV